MRSNETEQSPRRGYVLGAVAGLIAVVVVGVALVARDSDSVPPAATAAPATAPPTLPPVEAAPIELTGANGNAEAIEAFAVLVDAYEAFNDGDGMGWATARNAPDPPPLDVDDLEVEYVAAAHAAGARYEVASCEYDDRSSGIVGELMSVDGHRFTCQAKFIDAFSTAAGVDVDEEFTWVVADGRVVAAVSGFEDMSIVRQFMSALKEWVDREHPDTSFTTIGLYKYPLTSEVPAILELMDGFLAADDRYPLPGA